MLYIFINYVLYKHRKRNVIRISLHNWDYECVLLSDGKQIHNFLSNSAKMVKDLSKVTFSIIDKQYISFHLFL